MGGATPFFCFLLIGPNAAVPHIPECVGTLNPCVRESDSCRTSRSRTCVSRLPPVSSTCRRFVQHVLAISPHLRFVANSARAAARVGRAEGPQMSRLAQQWREATYVKQLPLYSLAAAASALFALALSERFIVGPMRKRQEALGQAPSVSIFGDIAVSRPNVEARQLPDGSMLLGDGSIVKKGASR